MHPHLVRSSQQLNGASFSLPSLPPCYENTTQDPAGELILHTPHPPSSSKAARFVCSNFQSKNCGVSLSYLAHIRSGIDSSGDPLTGKPGPLPRNTGHRPPHCLCPLRFGCCACVGRSGAPVFIIIHTYVFDAARPAVPPRHTPSPRCVLVESRRACPRMKLRVLSVALALADRARASSGIARPGGTSTRTWIQRPQKVK